MATAETKRINWSRVIVGGIVAGVVFTVLSSISTWFVGADFNSATGNKILSPSPSLATFLLIMNLAGGVWAMWLYAAIRPRYGAGPRTAALVGFSWWIVISLSDATWGSFGFVTWKSLWPLMAVTLPEFIVAALIGAWLYKE